MAMYAKVRRLRLRDGLSISEIARRTSLSRNTVKAWLKEPARTEMAYRRSRMPTKLDAHAEWLRQGLAADALRGRGVRRTMKRLFALLRERGYTGSYSRVTRFARGWRRLAEGAGGIRSAFVPLSFAWGEAFQFDWSEEGIVIGGVWRRVQLAHLKLCASRAFWLVAYPGQGHEMLFDAHTRGLAGLGGVARRDIYDNMKTAVDRVPGRGKARVVNARFAARAAHDLFEPDFCNVASGWEKGRVEKGVQDARRGIWQAALDLRWGSFGELNAWLAMQCLRLAPRRAAGRAQARRAAQRRPVRGPARAAQAPAAGAAAPAGWRPGDGAGAGRGAALRAGGGAGGGRAGAGRRPTERRSRAERAGPPARGTAASGGGNRPDPARGPARRHRATTPCARRSAMVEVVPALKALRLHGMAAAYADLVQQGGELAHAAWLLEHLLVAEQTDRSVRSVRYPMNAARFPVHRDLAGFDFA
jgi:transposase